jgi:cell division protein FtsW (lipid II flippase)
VGGAISLVGLALPIATALFGVVDDGHCLAPAGPLPAFQTSELIKVALIVFLAWYVEREGRTAEGRAVPWLGWLRLPGIRYLIPGILFVLMASLALVQMSDYGAVLILAFIFVGMLYAGFETRIFAAITILGLTLALLAGIILANTWEVPTIIRYRFLAFNDPEPGDGHIDGKSIGVTISQDRLPDPTGDLCRHRWRIDRSRPGIWVAGICTLAHSILFLWRS